MELYLILTLWFLGGVATFTIIVSNFEVTGIEKILTFIFTILFWIIPVTLGFLLGLINSVVKND